MHINTTNTANANQGPAYIGEISPKNTRGGFTAANQVIIESMLFSDRRFSFCTFTTPTIDNKIKWKLESLKQEQFLLLNQNILSFCVCVCFESDLF